VDPWTSATRLFYKLPIYLLTYTSNQNEKIMRLAVLILVSSLTYSVPIKPESKCFRVKQHYRLLLSTLPFVSLWMFEQNGLQSLKESAKPIKKDFNVLLTRSRGEEYMNGNIIKNAATKLTMEKAIISKCKWWCSVLSWQLLYLYFKAPEKIDD
jgi:hypothetical protein